MNITHQSDAILGSSLSITEIALATDVSGILYYVGSDNLVYKVEDVLAKNINPEVIGIYKNGSVVPITIPPEHLRAMRQTVPEEVIHQIKTIPDGINESVDDSDELDPEDYLDKDDDVIID